MRKSQRLEVQNHPSKFIKLRNPRQLIFLTQLNTNISRKITSAPDAAVRNVQWDRSSVLFICQMHPLKGVYDELWREKEEGEFKRQY